MFLMLCLKTHLQTHGHLDFLLCYLLEVFYFCIYIQVYDLFVVSFSGKYKVCQNVLFYMGMSTCSSKFVEKTILSQLNCLHHFVGDQSIVFVCVCSWALLCFNDLFVLLSISHHFDYYSLMVNLAVGQRQSSDIVLLQYCVGYSGSFAFLYKLQNQFVDIHKITCWDFD